jgi:hypothetical protein
MEEVVALFNEGSSILAQTKATATASASVVTSPIVGTNGALEVETPTHTQEHNVSGAVGSTSTSPYVSASASASVEDASKASESDGEPPADPPASISSDTNFGDGSKSVRDQARLEAFADDTPSLVETTVKGSDSSERNGRRSTDNGSKNSKDAPRRRSLFDDDDDDDEEADPSVLGLVSSMGALEGPSGSFGGDTRSDQTPAAAAVTPPPPPKPEAITADGLLPLFTYVLLHSDLSNLLVPMEVMLLAGDDADALGEVGYYLATIEAAASHIHTLDADFTSASLEKF